MISRFLFHRLCRRQHATPFSSSSLEKVRAKQAADIKALANAFQSKSKSTDVHSVIHKKSSALHNSLFDGTSAASPVFTLAVLPTADRGHGVFVTSQGGVKAGTALCFYGGLLYSKQEVQWLGGHPIAFQQADPRHSSASPAAISHLIGCAGGDVIDGAPDLHLLGVEVRSTNDDISLSTREQATPVGFMPDQTFECRDALLERESTLQMNSMAIDADLWHEYLGDNRMLCMGSKINHPPQGSAVNVVGWPVVLGEEGDEGDEGDEEGNEGDEGEEGEEGEEKKKFATARMHGLFPTAHAVRSGTFDPRLVVCSKKTVVFIAAVDIGQDEELFLDYRLEASSAVPPEWFISAEML